MLIHLTHHGLVKISGEQAKQFLQGQLTCDLAEIDSQHSRLGAYCDHKGRILTDLRLYYANQNYYLLVNKSLIEKTITQLKKYAIYSKVAVEDCSSLFVIAAYLGYKENDGPDIHNYLGDLPQAIDEVAVKENLIIIRVPGIHPRYEIIIDKQNFSAPDLPSDLSDAVANARWQLENIRAGIPTIYPATSEMFTPHMLNYHLINSISFSKGCFIGQEIIARTQHLGKLKRHTYRMQVTTNKQLKAGDAVFSAQQEVGTIVDVSAVPQFKSTYELLVMLHDEEFIKQGINASIEGRQAERFTLLNLPYSLAQYQPN